jgi:hypothetical protein
MTHDLVSSLFAKINIFFRGFMKNYLFIIMAAITMIFGCNSSYYSYKKGEVPVHINHIQIIPIWIDLRFTEVQRKEIILAVKEWNSVFNGQILLKHEGYFNNGIDGAEEKYKIINKTSLGWIIIRVNESDDLVKDVIGTKDLAFVSGLGSHLMFVIGDRLGTRSLKDITMHEMGHLLGANHVNFNSLMCPVYGELEYNCIDKITVAQVAGFNKLDLKNLNYCITPHFE